MSFRSGEYGRGRGEAYMTRENSFARGRGAPGGRGGRGGYAGSGRGHGVEQRPAPELEQRMQMLERKLELQRNSVSFLNKSVAQLRLEKRSADDETRRLQQSLAQERSAFNKREYELNKAKAEVARKETIILELKTTIKDLDESAVEAATTIAEQDYEIKNLKMRLGGGGFKKKAQKELEDLEKAMNKLRIAHEEWAKEVTSNAQQELPEGASEVPATQMALGERLETRTAQKRKRSTSSPTRFSLEKTQSEIDSDWREKREGG